MVRFKMNGVPSGGRWHSICARDLQQNSRLLFQAYEIEINGTVFLKNNAEFRTLLDKEIMWENLRDRIQNKTI